MGGTQVMRMGAVAGVRTVGVLGTRVPFCTFAGLVSDVMSYFDLHFLGNILNV